MGSQIANWLSALSVGVAAAAVIISTIQYRAAKAKLKLDPFERRYAIFQVAWEALSRPVTEQASDPRCSTVGNVIPQAEFLMGKDVADYLRLIQSKTLAKWSIERLPTLSSEKSSDFLQLMSWFEYEAKEGVRARFNRYLSFDIWR